MMDVSMVVVIHFYERRC